MTMQRPGQRPYILGVDLGANSMGWVCLAAKPSGSGWEPTGLLHPATEMNRWPTLGVRIFKEGVASFDTGDEEGPGAARRRARHMRRQTMRRARRMRKTFRLLQSMALLPPLDPETGQETLRSEEARRDSLLKRLDRELARARAERMEPSIAHRAHDMLPYILRTEALSASTPLSPYELGRAFYHLAQRRGFLSNRKDAGRDEEKDEASSATARPAAAGKKVPLKQQMSELQAAIERNGHRSLGEHLLWRVVEKGERIRNLKPRRFMYRREFELMWAAQAPHHPAVMTPDAKKRLYLAIFKQRPLQDQSGRIGLCSLEDGENSWVDEHGVLHKTQARRRAPVSSLIAERFTALQRLNDVRILDKTTGVRRAFSDEERGRLMRELELRKSMTATDVAKLLGWSSRKVGVEINFDDRTGAALPGLWTNQQLTAIFGDRWTGLGYERREAIVWDLLHRDDPEWYEEDPDDPEPRERDPVIVRAALAADGPWASLPMSQQEARRLVTIKMRSDHASLSAVAMRRLLPRMEQGEPFLAAVGHCYSQPQAPIRDRLPKVDSVFRALSNPVVSRGLTELRRVVNQLIALHGKPAQIRIEVTREVKKGRKGRDAVRDAQAKNRALKQAAVKAHCDELGVPLRDPDQARDVEKIRLWHEQGFYCPYTVQPIPAARVCSADTEIDHVLPFSRSQDNSFTNKVLVFQAANQEKGQRIPREAFESSDPDRWRRIEAWVAAERKKRHMSGAKLDRIMMTTEDAAAHLDAFRSRQLNDTGWASSWARKYLMTLYGGDVTNGVDADGRRRILACAGEATADVRRELGLEQLLKKVMDPNTPMPERWTKRVDQRHHVVDALAVAWFGPKMSETLSRAAEKAPEERRRLYARLPRLGDELEGDIEAALRRCIPSYRIDNRVRGPLHKETIISPHEVASGTVKTFVEVGGRKPHRKRIVHDSGNHHMLVVASGDAGAPDIRGRVVTNWIAAQRVVAARKRSKAGAPKDTSAPYEREPGTRFTLAINEVIEVRRGNEPQGWLARVVTLERDGRVCVAPIHETRTPRSRAEALRSPKTYIPQDGLRLSIGTLVSNGSRKHTISPIGVLRPCRA